MTTSTKNPTNLYWIPSQSKDWFSERTGLTCFQWGLHQHFPQSWKGKLEVITSINCVLESRLLNFTVPFWISAHPELKQIHVLKDRMYFLSEPTDVFYRMDTEHESFLKCWYRGKKNQPWKGQKHFNLTCSICYPVNKGRIKSWKRKWSP